MTELEIDQSHLPQVQKEPNKEGAITSVCVNRDEARGRAPIDQRAVCQCFAVLEDGALAHNLQEQEIEQYYTSNVQKNQLVQKDVRIARRLQDEEERAVLLSQASRQLEEQDFEYARMIQEEIRRCAEEARRREEEDEEMAKRIQEEEEMDVRRRKLESGCHGNTNGFPLNEEHPSPPDPPPSPHYAPATFCPSLGEASHRHSTTRGQCPVSHTGSDSVTEPLNPNSQNNSAPQLGLGPPAILRLIKNDLSDSHRLGKNSGDEVFLAMPSIVANRPWKHLRNSPFTQQSHMQEGWIHSIHCGSRKEGNVRGQGEGIVGLGWEGSHYSSCGADLRSAGKGDRSGRYTDLCPLDKIHSWTYSEGRATGERHVRFQDEGRAFHSYHGDRRRVSLGSSHNGGPGDRCVVGSHGYHGDLAQGTGDLRVDHVQSDIERAAGQLMQSDKRWHSYRGNNGKYSQRGSCKEHGQMGGPGRDLVRHHEGLTNKGASHWANKDWDCNSRFPQTGNAGYHRDGVERKGGGCDSHRNQRQRGGGAAHANGNQGGGATRKVKRRVRGRASGRWRGSVEESSSEEEEEEVLQREERRKRGLRRNASVSKRAAGAELWQRGACLELGALQQVLLDEELARRLQEEEDQIHRKSPRSPISLHTSGTEADFRAAQVAQDEEIARYIQRQEVKTKRRSHDLEAQELRRNCGDTGNSCEMRLTRERKLQVPRERLDSEGLTSPTEDRTPEHQPPSPVNTPLQRQAIRNIAEELDPTFKARRKNSCPAGLTSPGLCQAPLTPNRIFQDYMEEPMFIPPTKRNSEKSGRGKAKEKKEGCKQQ